MSSPKEPKPESANKEIKVLQEELNELRREREIEAALERVRSRTMEMQCSDELSETSFLLDQEVRNLGIKTWGCAFNIYREKDSIEWFGNEKGVLPTYTIPRKGIFKKYYDLGQKGSSIHVQEFKGQKCIEHYEYMSTLPVIGDVLKKLKKTNGSFPEYQIDHVVYFKYGYLLFITIDPVPEAHDIFKRFAKVFEQTYTRFLDLQKAEGQAREAQIEAALERVRSQAMAMHAPNDLVKVNETMINEISGLGIKNLTGAAIILFNENDILTMWDISDPGNMGNVRDNKSIYDPRDFDVLGDFWRRWKDGEKYFVIEYDFQTVTTALEEWKKVDYENYLSLKRAIDEDKLKTQWNPFASFSKGLLTLDLMEAPDADTEKIMIKMANAFDLAYQRFDDLQKAAEQAKEAQKQASLDRIRAEIASMRNKRDLEKLTPFIWMELSTLGIAFFRCGIFIMDSQSRDIDMYLSTPKGDSLAVITLDFGNSDITLAASKAWEKQKVYREKWTKEQFIGWSKNLLEQGLIDSPETYQFSDVPPEILCLQFLPFNQGMLYIGTENYLDDNDMELIQDVADAFSIAYTRYEDFIQLEKAKQLSEDALGELRSTQSQLIHSEKMASLGELTAGIAHEIQNPLNFVNNFSDLNIELVDELREALDTGDMEEVKEILNDLKSNEQKIIHHGKRAEDIVKGMLQHSRGGDGKKELTDINALADEFLRLSYHGLRAKDKSFNADFICQLDKDLPKVKVISQDIGRVLLNLINNAFHATAERLNSNGTTNYKPKVEVITESDEENLIIHVRDNGAGIPKKIKEKIFQPFFTTKATGSGTGLGLSLSHDIVTKGHGGKIELESTEGKGTTFTVKIPLG